MKPRRPLSLLSLVLLLTPFGCQNDNEIQLRRQLDKCVEQTEQKDRQIAAQNLTIRKLNKQLQLARGLTDDDLTKLFYPVEIEIDSLSGGDDYDGKPGDDGITVYLTPIDRDHDAIKVAGDIRIELYDLENPSGQKLIGEYVFPVEEVSRLWYGKLSTYHFTLRCPWKNGPPQHDEITIRATFVDYLTRRVMSAQYVCKANVTP